MLWPFVGIVSLRRFQQMSQHWIQLRRKEIFQIMCGYFSRSRRRPCWSSWGRRRRDWTRKVGGTTTANLPEPSTQLTYATKGNTLSCTLWLFCAKLVSAKFSGEPTQKIEKMQWNQICCFCRQIKLIIPSITRINSHWLFNVTVGFKVQHILCRRWGKLRQFWGCKRSLQKTLQCFH